MSSSIASQLRALKAAVNFDDEPLKQPFTRPSIMFSPKAAADIDLDTIFEIASSGLDVLISTNEAFSTFKLDLFSENSKEYDREVSSIEVNNRINASIASFLKLLSGYFYSLRGPAMRTLEYLLRRYKVHVYNIEELILCALPYHETFEFVRVVQLIDTGNTRWKFLAGVKASGAPLPRSVIVQQCVRDQGVLEVICGFAIPAKNVQPAKTVTGFCTAVAIEVLGSLTVITSDVVNRILPYVLSGLQPISLRNRDHKAGALMIVGVLALKTEMSAALVRTLIHSVVGVVREHLKEANDLQLFRMPLMALINLVQLQNVGLISRKSMDVLIEIRDIVEILSGFTEEFEINKFLSVFLNSLLEYSSADQTYHRTLMAMIETIPLQFYVHCLVAKLLKTCTKISGDMDQPRSSELGSQANEILVSLYKEYPTELCEAMEKVLQHEKKGSNELFLKIIDGDGKLSRGAPDSGIFFALEHPKAEIRRSAVMGLDVAGILKDKAVNSKAFDVTQDAIVRRLLDDDLTIVQAALNLQHLNKIISASVLLDTLQSVLERCIFILMSGASDGTSMASDVAISCLRLAITTFKDNFQFSKKLAKMMLPLILILPKTQKLNLESLELVKEVKWPLFGSLVKLSGSEKKPSLKDVRSVNVKNIGKLAETFMEHCDELMPWLLECSNTNELSKTVYFLILLQSSMVQKPDFTQFSVLFDASFQLLQREENVLELAGVNAEESNLSTADGDCRTFLKRLTKISGDELNVEILICLCWRLVEGFVITLPDNGINEIWSCKLQSLFVFFVTRKSQVFRKQLQYLVAKCKSSLLGFLSKMFTEEGFAGQVQAESLRYFGHLCSLAEADEDLTVQLLNEFPSLLVPLTSDDQVVRHVAMGCCEELLKLWTHANLSRNKNELYFLGELLGYMGQKKILLLSDSNFFRSMFQCLLSSTDSLLVPTNTGKRFEQSTKDDILRFLLSSALKLPASAKLKIISLLKGLGNKVAEFSEIKLLMGDLLRRRQEYHIMHNEPAQKLCSTDIHLLNLLIEMCTMCTSSIGGDYFEYFVMALKVNGSASDDSAVVEPCITVLKHLSSSLHLGLKTENQEILIRYLVVLLRNGNTSIRNSAREALLQINTNYVVVGKMLGSIGDYLSSLSGSIHGRKKKKSAAHLDDLYLNVFQRGDGALSFLSSLLDVLLLKKDMENRSLLIDPLNKVLRLIFVNDEWVPRIVDEAMSPEVSVSNFQVYIQQTSLSVLEDICSSSSVSEKDAIINNLDLELLVKCARLSSDAVTRNHVLSLFSAVAKVVPDKVLNHILDILNVIGESAVTKWDAYSQSVFEKVLSAVVPFCSSQTGDVEKLLQIFVDVLPQVPQHQKLSVMICLLRNLGESESFGSFLFLLFNSALKSGISSFAERELVIHLKSAIKTQWEYIFALELSAQYSSTIWLPSLVVLLERLGKAPWNKDHFLQLLVAMQFVLDKLQNPEFLFKLESGEYADEIQLRLGALLEQAVYLLQQVNIRGKHAVVSSDLRKGQKELMHHVLKSIVKSLVPVSYFGVMIQLLRHTDKNVRKKALALLCETAKEGGAMNKVNQRRGFGKGLRTMWLEFDESAQKSLNKMCMEILNLVDDSDLDSGGAALKLASISTLEALVYRFPLDDLILLTCLKSVSMNISSSNSSVSSACLRTTSALINVLGPKALSELPRIMESMFHKSRDISLLIGEDINNHDGSVSVSSRTASDSIVMSVLVILEALVDKLGGFLNPYLGSLLKLLVLHPCYAATTDVKIKMRADLVRKLVTDKIPVRLLLPALKRIYSDAIKSGGSSVSITFEMLGDMVHLMDRSAIAAFHVQIFDLGLLALDLRGQHSDSINSIHAVEEKIFVFIVSLTLKLTETMFKPLFVKSIEWSRSHTGEGEEGKNIDRSLSFYGLVNKLVESHRSLFVPFFKYLLDGCIHHLSEDTQVGLTPKKKKLKSHEGIEKKVTGSELSLGVWHLRALITSALQKCFLYDTGSLRFLDSSNFQALLKPLVSQLVVDPPASLVQHPEAPSVEKVDDILVACIGQMAVTCGSDLLWKPLNHEVLMQTRSGKVRARMLGLRIVKYLVENLKEEYLVLLPETIPFLGELLEDVEIPVKTLAQVILKQMEFMSGESLREYL